ncbi:hypothetical protein PIB30_042303 [Stylosanthes scabra]|uniref:Uncharacterized protein n=1 Tax=Stylosanthes scabra TaxID=79078 RepID=A0ABU6XEE0_9FABA|nr:hypothetical protein [Stylosanthes scabra]
MSDEKTSPLSTSTEESNNSEATNVGQLFGQNSENLEAMGPMHPHDVIDTDMVVGSTFQSWHLPGITAMNLPQGLTNLTSTMTFTGWAMYGLPTGYSNMCNKPIYAHTQIPQSGHTQLDYPQSRLPLSGYHQSKYFQSEYLPMYVTGGFNPNFDYVAYQHLINNHPYMGVVSLTQPMSNVFSTQAMVSTPHGVSTGAGAGAGSNRPLTSLLPTQAIASTPHIVLTGAGSESIFQGMPSQILAEKTPPNNAVRSFPVFRQQMEESHRDIVNMLT